MDEMDLGTSVEGGAIERQSTPIQFWVCLTCYVIDMEEK